MNKSTATSPPEQVTAQKGGCRTCHEPATRFLWFVPMCDKGECFTAWVTKVNAPWWRKDEAVNDAR